MSDADRPDNERTADRWHHLPKRVQPEDQVTSQPATEAPDVNGGRNPDHDWLLRGV